MKNKASTFKRKINIDGEEWSYHVCNHQGVAIKDPNGKLKGIFSDIRMEHSPPANVQDNLPWKKYLCYKPSFIKEFIVENLIEE